MANALHREDHCKINQPIYSKSLLITFFYSQSNSWPTGKDTGGGGVKCFVKESFALADEAEILISASIIFEPVFGLNTQTDGDFSRAFIYHRCDNGDNDDDILDDGPQWRSSSFARWRARPPLTRRRTSGPETSRGRWTK